MTPLQVQNFLDKIHFIKNLIIGGAARFRKSFKKFNIQSSIQPKQNLLRKLTE